jgi:hypothetical protein
MTNIYELKNSKYIIMNEKYDLIPDESKPFEKKIIIVNNIIEEPLYSFKMFPFHKTKNNYIDPLLENILVVEIEDDYKTLSKSSYDSVGSSVKELEKLNALYQSQLEQGFPLMKKEDKTNISDSIKKKKNEKNEKNDKKKKNKNKNKKEVIVKTKKMILHEFYNKLILKNIKNDIFDILTFKKIYFQMQAFYNNIHVFYSFGDIWFELSNKNLRIQTDDHLLFKTWHSILKNNNELKKKTKNHYDRGYKYDLKTTFSNIIIYVIYREKL